MAGGITVAIMAGMPAAVSTFRRRALHTTIITGNIAGSGITIGSVARYGITRRDMSIPGAGETTIIGGSAGTTGVIERLEGA